MKRFFAALAAAISPVIPRAVSLTLALALVITLMAGCSSAGSSGAPTNHDSYYYNEGGTASQSASAAPSASASQGDSGMYQAAPYEGWRYVPVDGTEEYAAAPESPFKDAKINPLSTFSADVDTASYSNMRRFIKEGQEPVGIRIEELVNYFDYSYPAPVAGYGHPFSISTEIGACPWESDHLLAMIGIQGARLGNTENIANNIVFLIDVSGSMNAENKLPLVIDSMKLLMEQLDGNDRISIVTYAGSDRVIADSVPGNETRELKRMVNNLSAGGSTAGARGLRTAYDLAAKNYIDGGNNRVILATDGDFNVGESNVDALTELIENERDRGVYISVLGFGMGNLKDNMMEAIAANGNGNYAYIDTIQEAKKVLVDEFDSTMFTIAKDVKLQVEFNPETVSAYRLIGYETRRLEDEDFNDDLKDAGDIGSGHNVTAFYELVLAENRGEGESDSTDPLVDPLKYSSSVTTGSDDFMTVKVRYKAPEGRDSMLVEHVVGADALDARLSDNFVFASAVAEFGLIVSGSDYREDSSLRRVVSRAEDALGRDEYGLRAEFLELVQEYARIAG